MAKNYDKLIKLEKKILSSWKKEYIHERAPEYPIYPVEDMQVILTTDNRALKQYKHIPRKGIVREISDTYELEVLNKVSKEYGVRLNPNLYYVMWSN